MLSRRWRSLCCQACIYTPMEHIDNAIVKFHSYYNILIGGCANKVVTYWHDGWLLFVEIWASRIVAPILVEALITICTNYKSFSSTSPRHICEIGWTMWTKMWDWRRCWMPPHPPQRYFGKKNLQLNVGEPWRIIIEFVNNLAMLLQFHGVSLNVAKLLWNINSCIVQKHIMYRKKGVKRCQEANPMAFHWNVPILR